jgi:uncharacterized protein (TIGR04255 family)
MCGLVFKSGLLEKKFLLYRLIEKIRSEYSDLKVQPAIFEETLHNGEILNNLDYNATGFSLHRLQSDDKHFMVMIQNNFILLHWMRQDKYKVGSYPGFESVLKRFQVIIDNFLELYNSEFPEIDLDKYISATVLSYVDRIEIGGLRLNDIVNIGDPAFYLDDVDPVLKMHFAKNIEELAGYSLTNIQTQRNHFDAQILQVVHKVKGRFSIENMEKWFHLAHKEQLSFFEHLFTTEIKAAWKS